MSLNVCYFQLNRYNKLIKLILSRLGDKYECYDWEKYGNSEGAK
jgi:hypothetical protein